MACYHPVDVAILRKPAAGSALRSPDTVTVPCGHCLGCRTDQARSWAIRIMHEAQVREHAWFLTLTYSDEKLPENGSLRPDDLSAFIKRLRTKFPPRSLSFYGCGEYGESTDRPHYHAVLCGPALLDRDYFTHRSGSPVWLSETVASAWGHGLHELTAVTYGAAQYVAGYVRKKIRKQDNPDAYLRVNPVTGELHQVEQEFSRCSTRPAIGRLWIERYWRDVYPRDYVVMDGKEFKPPRYYDKWMEENQPEIMAEVREQRIKDAREIGDEKLIMKEKIHRARVALYSKRDKI